MQSLSERNNNRAGMRRLITGAAVLWTVLIAASLFYHLSGISWHPVLATLTHGAILTLGLMGLAGAVRYFRRQDQGRARIEALLRDSEAKYRTVADFTYDWEYWIDHGGLRYVSPSCERMTGYRPDEFIADPGLLGTIVHPAVIPRLLTRLRPTWISASSLARVKLAGSITAVCRFLIRAVTGDAESATATLPSANKLKPNCGVLPGCWSRCGSPKTCTSAKWSHNGFLKNCSIRWLQ